MSLFNQLFEYFSNFLGDIEYTPIGNGAVDSILQLCTTGLPYLLTFFTIISIISLFIFFMYSLIRLFTSIFTL